MSLDFTDKVVFCGLKMEVEIDKVVAKGAQQSKW